MSIANTIRLAIVLTITLFAASPAMALRCGNKIVSEGLTQAEVRKYCGAPASTQERRVVIAGAPRRLSQSGIDQRSSQTLLIEERGYEEVQVDEWTYNFGPRRFMSLIRFTNGQVTVIEDLGYGYHD